MTVLGFDFGGERTGIAVGQTLTGTASALQTVKTPYKNAADWQVIADLIGEWQPERLIVGCPLHLDGASSETTLAAKKFANRLRDRFNLPVELMDERLSSREAERRFREQRQLGATRRKDQQRLDANAAQIILESYLAKQQ